MAKQSKPAGTPPVESPPAPGETTKPLAKPAKPAAKRAQGPTRRVRLLVSRTGFGRAGTIVEDYPSDEAERHSRPPFESVELLD